MLPSEKQVMLRLVLSAVLLMILVGCGSSGVESPTESGVEYGAETFRSDLTVLIRAEQFGDAVALVRRADVQAQLAHDETGYMLIAEDLIFRPGVPDDAYFPEDGDWELPGTSDAVIHGDWQDAATAFAVRYNTARWGAGTPMSPVLTVVRMR